MTETPTSRIAELQRLAYGQAVPDAERQLALAELASLSNASHAPDAAATRDAVDAAAPWSRELPVVGRAAGGGSADAVAASRFGSDGAGPPAGAAGIALAEGAAARSVPDAAAPDAGSPDPSGGDPSAPDASVAPDPARRRWAITAIIAVAALALGGVAGWQVRDAGAQAQLISPQPDSIFAEYAGDDPAAAFDDSPAGRIFARPGTDADVLAPQHREMIALDRAGQPIDSGLVVSRLLATRSDGTTVFAAVVADEAVCVVAVLVNGASGASCAPMDRFMVRGASAGVSGGSGGGPSIEYAFAPDGILRVSGAD